MEIRPMRHDEEEAVRGLFHRCHPGELDPQPGWYFIHPTLVAVLDGVVVGYTSFHVNTAPGYGQVLYGQDVGVHPAHRKTGIATKLHAARLQAGWVCGARVFIGMTQPENHGMISVLEGAGAHQCLTVPGQYPHSRHSTDGVMFVGSIKEAR